MSATTRKLGSILLLMLLGCTAKEKTAKQSPRTVVKKTVKTYRADHSLLVATWTQEYQNKFPLVPFVARYKDGHKEFSFVAAFHGNDFENETNRKLKQEFDRLRPQVVIVEGIFSDQGFSPEPFVSQARASLDDRSRIKSERMYAMHLAEKAMIPFIGGEPSFAAEKEFFIRNSYQLEDLTNYYIFRQMQQWKREYPKPNFEELVAEFALDLKKRLSLNERELPTLKKFKRWYEKKNSRPFTGQELRSEARIPADHDDALFTQRLHFLSLKVRDVNITNIIAKMLNLYDRVLIVYGLSHYRREAKILDKMLGSSPTIVQ